MQLPILDVIETVGCLLMVAAVFVGFVVHGDDGHCDYSVEYVTEYIIDGHRIKMSFVGRLGRDWEDKRMFFYDVLGCSIEPQSLEIIYFGRKEQFDGN